MLENTTGKSFAISLLASFFLISASYNISYFYTFGDSLSFFLYLPLGFTDLVRTGLVASLYVIIFLGVFKSIFIDPVFNDDFPTVSSLLFLSVLVFISNLFYFLILDPNYKSGFYLISELAFFAFSLVAFFGILYFFCRQQSKDFLMGCFVASLIGISFFVGWLSATFDINRAPFESKSKILLVGDKIITAKVLRSFDKGMLVMLNNSTDINFISWDQVKEAKFKKVTGF